MLWCFCLSDVSVIIFPSWKGSGFFQELPATAVFPWRDPKKDVFEAEYWIAIKVIFQPPANC